MPPRTPAPALAGLIATLLAMLGARLERPGRPGLAGPVILAVANRLQRLHSRLTRLIARWEAGTLTPPRRRPPPRRRAPRAPGPWDHLPHLPRGRGWLPRLVPGSGVGAAQLRRLLDEPGMQALLEAAPQAGRVLRPLWHILSAEPPPPLLRRPPPAPAPAEEAKAEPEARPPRSVPRPPATARPSAAPPAAPPIAACACGPPLPA